MLSCRRKHICEHKQAIYFWMSKDAIKVRPMGRGVNNDLKKYNDNMHEDTAISKSC